MHALPAVRRLAVLVSLVCALISPAFAAGSATLAGTVSNSATGNLLEGARVEVPALGLATLTDNTGRYVLAGVPAGAHEVVVSYLGLDPIRRTVTFGAGQPADQNFD